MITAKEIRHALRFLVAEKAQIPYEVSFNFFEKPKQSYVWIDVRPTKSSIDNAYFQWSIDVDIQVILLPDEYTFVEHDELWAISDKLTSAVMPCVEIETEDEDKSKTRYVTVQSFNSYIVDEILHYEFNLDFTDYAQSDEYEGLAYDLMENLELNFSPEEKEKPNPSAIIQSLLEGGYE